MEDNAIPLILKLVDWPVEDKRRWERCLAPGILFDNTSGAFASWSEGTRRYHAQGYGTWLSFILRRHPEMFEQASADRITQKMVEAYVEEGRTRLKLRSIANALFSLVTVAGGFSPNADLSWLWRGANRIYQQSEPNQLKPPIPVSARALFVWSLRRLSHIMAQEQVDSRSIAIEFRQALNVGLLIACPVRVRAFVAMTVSRHVEVTGDQIMLSFDRCDMKDAKARRLPVSGSLTPFLFEYIAVYRPRLLAGRDSDALWISERGNPLGQDSFTAGLALLTKREFGVTLRPYAFRHIAATSIATTDPANSGIIRDVLGHATIRMSELHYNRATAREASERLQDVLRDIRKRSRMSKARRGRTTRVAHEDREK